MIVDVYYVFKFLKKLTTPFKDWGAFSHGIIDEKGNILRKRSELTTIAERESWTKFDLMVLKLKKLLEKVPGGDTKLATYAAALWLIKEGKHTDTEFQLNEDIQLAIDELLEEINIDEELPANNTSNVAGLTPDSVPGKKIKRKLLKRMKLDGV